MTRLLLLHPIGLDGDSGKWLHLPPYHSPDLPGHGTNSALAIGSLEDLADWVAGGLAEPTDVIGALLGGAVGMHLALRYPHLVRSLVLAGTDSRLDTQRLDHRADTVLDGSFGPDDILPGWFGANLCAPRLHDQISYAKGRLRAISAPNYAAAWRALASHDVDARLGELTMPITVISAGADHVHDSDAQARLSRRLPLSRVAQIDAHHMSILDAPDTFSSRVDEHLRWVRSLKG